MKAYLEIEMPKYGCDNCFLRTGNYCGRIEKDESVVKYTRKNERHPNCPLIPVPEHGRLIDADALEASCFMGSSSFYTQSDIDYAPTIIPADHFRGTTKKEET